VLPNTFIIGAQKSGTTALHRLLAAHPDVYFPAAPQEIHFFDLDENFLKGIAWYEALFRDWGGQRIVAQTSPLYFFQAAVPGRMRQLVPEAKLIVILRNPVDRAYSHYWHSVKHGVETLTFEEAIQQESRRMQEGLESRRNFSYLSRGRYAEQFRRFLENYPAQRILPLRFDDLAGDLQSLFARCSDFLGIPAHGFSSLRKERAVRNAARMPRSRAVQAVSKRIGRRLPWLQRRIDKFNLAPAPYPPMKPETRRLLQAYFREEVREIAALTGLGLAHWME
jgi:hypothetical protein